LRHLSKLVINPDAVLASAITTQCFHPIAEWHFEIFQLICELKLTELPQCNPLKICEPPDTTPTG